MTIDLTCNEKREILKIIKDNFLNYYPKYQSSKYPEVPYAEWKECFPNPKIVKSENISKL